MTMWLTVFDMLNYYIHQVKPGYQNGGQNLSDIYEDSRCGIWVNRATECMRYV